MAVRTTNFPTSNRMAAFRAVDVILREDPILLAAGVRIRSWTGDQMDGVPITSNQTPMIRISPEVMPNKPFTQGKYAAVMGIRVELFVSGMIAEDIVAFHEAVEQAMVLLKPFRDTTVQCYLIEQCGSTRLNFSQPAYGSWQNKDNPPDNGLAGVGRIEVEILVNR